jgi:hypothetical protein
MGSKSGKKKKKKKKKMTAAHVIAPNFCGRSPGYSLAEEIPG